MAARNEGKHRSNQIDAMPKLRGSQTPILARRDRAELGAGELDFEIFSTVLGQDRDTVPATDAERHEHRRGLVDPVVELRVGPSPVFALERGAVWIELGLAAKHGPDGRRASLAHQARGKVIRVDALHAMPTSPEKFAPSFDNA